MTPSTFGDCLITCLQDEKMVEAFDQLHGTDVRALLASASTIEHMGMGADYDLAEFAAYVYDTVWMRGEGSADSHSGDSPA